MDIKLLVIFIAGHFLADFALQTRFMAENKKLVFIKSIGFYALTGHAFTHGLVAGVIAQNFQIGVLIGSSHWLIDFLRSSELLNGRRKNKELFSINVDQFLHISVLVLAVLIY